MRSSDLDISIELELDLRDSIEGRLNTPYKEDLSDGKRVAVGFGPAIQKLQKRLINSKENRVQNQNTSYSWIKLI